jgi:hypothetical protein
VGPYGHLAASSGLLEAARGVLKDEPVVYRPVECRRKNSLHHADGVGVEVGFNLAGLERPDMRRRKVPQFHPAEEGYQVIAARPLVSAVGGGGDLVAGRIG